MKERTRLGRNIDSVMFAAHPTPKNPWGKRSA